MNRMRVAVVITGLLLGTAGGLLLRLSGGAAGGGYQAPPVNTDEGFQPNFLVLLADDLGQDMVGAYDVHPRTPPTPNLDQLASQGLIFDHAIANPVCSPTRATLMTGRYSHRYGIGSAIPPRKGWGLPDSEVILPRALKDAGADYASAAVGKWHLATPDMGGVTQAIDAGFDHHYGTTGNLLGRVPSTKKTMNYYHWSKLEDGRPRVSESYVTSVSVDDAVAFSRELPEPWFIYVAFHAAHFPMHLPPEEHFTQELPKYPTEGQLYRVMVEALDHEIGRLLDGMNPDVRDRTNVLFLGDNGSAPVGVLPPWPKSQTKGALTRGGVRVPFIMAGPSVAARGVRTDALVNTTDLFATVFDLAGIDVPPPDDSISFAPVLSDPDASTRQFAFAEHFSPNGMGPWDEHSVAIRDDRYKLVVRNGRPQAMYDLQQDKMERRNLLKVKPRGEAFQRFRQLKYALPEGIELAERPTAEEIRLSGFDPDARL